MSVQAVIAIIAIVFVLLLITGHYISSILMVAGVIGIYLIYGPSQVTGFLTALPYNTVASYTLTTMPLYIVMANFIMRAGIIEDLYELIFRLTKGKASALGIFTVILGGFLGAVSGSGLATAAGLSKMSYPELRSRGYSPELGSAIAAVSGSLSAIIPPSAGLVLYGVTAQVSIASLFMAAFIPGIIMVVVYALFVSFFFHRDRKKGVVPLSDAEKAMRDEHATGGHQTKAQYYTVLISGAAIMVVIFGGIYSGLFTPTEAGGVGAAIGLIALLLSGNFSFKFFIQAIVDAVKADGMILLMIVSAGLFSKFITLSMVPRMVVTALQPLIERPAILLAIITVVYFILFMLLDGSSPILMTVPILAPVVVAAGYDLVWFGIFVSVAGCIGQVTPPVGLATYTVSGITKVPSGRIFKLTFVMAIAQAVIVGGILIAFPAITNILPSLLG